MLWAWGEAESGALGMGPPTSAPPQRRRCENLPVAVKVDAVQAAIVQVSAGDAHCLACDELGGTYCWGRTREGQCGQLSITPVEQPRLMSELLHEWVVRVACGADASFALTAGGSLYQWGAVHVPSTALAHADLAGYGRSFDSVSDATRLMLRRSVSDFLSGRDGNEQPGDDQGGEPDEAAPETLGTRRELRPVPQRVPLPPGERASHVAAGFGFTVVALSGGGAVTFGTNDRFQLGLMDRMPRDVPTRVPALGQRRLVGVACGQQHAVVLDEGGAAWSWGLGSFGQLGHGRKMDERKPRRVDALWHMGRVEQVACGHLHSAFVLRPRPEVGAVHGVSEAFDAAAARLLGCGHAEYGQLGTGDAGNEGDAARDYALPRWIELPRESDEPSMVSCGAQHTCVLTVRGECLTFGWGSTGALGHGTFGYQLTAQPVAALRARRLVSVCAGTRHTLVIERGTEGGAALSRDLGNLLMLASAGGAGGGADFAIRAGRGPSARGFVAHRSVVACRCPRLLAMLALGSERFSRPPPAATPPAPEWQWPGQTATTGDASSEKASAALPELRLPSVRAPIFALLLSWIYTGRFQCTERLFLEQLAAAATLLRLPALTRECRALCAGEEGGGAQDGAQEGALSVPARATPTSSLGADLGALVESGSLPQSFASLRLEATDGCAYACPALLCCRCDFFRTMLHGSFREATAREQHTAVDLTPYGISLAELSLLLRFIYCGQVTCASSQSGGDLANLAPADALALIPHASALLMDDLKRLCEAVLVAVVDEENAAALLDVAERCFAVRLKATCADVLHAASRGFATTAGDSRST